MSDSGRITGPKYKNMFMAKVFTMRNMKIRSILPEVGDIVAHLAFMEPSSGPGLFFAYAHPPTNEWKEGRLGSVTLRTTDFKNLKLVTEAVSSGCIRTESISSSTRSALQFVNTTAGAAYQIYKQLR